MCGIVGYIGSEKAAPKLIDGLKKLEYRGYDSAGIAVLDGGVLRLEKRCGMVSELKYAACLSGNAGIGHTRWATHGVPSQANAHPHACGKFALVHNGIIENYGDLREELESEGRVFLSDTDSEAVVQLIDKYYEGDFLRAVKRAVERLSGSFAIVVLCADFPHEIVCARRRSPLVVGRGKKGAYIASDIPAAAESAEEIYVLSDGEFAVVSDREVAFYDGDLRRKTKKKAEYDRQKDVVALNGYRHFMRKEIDEIPLSVRNSLLKIAENNEYRNIYEVLCLTEQIQIVACGTAYHSGLAAKYAIEALARVPVEVCVASEYRYRNPVVKRGTLVIAVSQSGETADTIAAAELAKKLGAALLAVTNVPYSSLTTVADYVLFTVAGREIAVAATKSYNAQLASLYSIALALAKIRRQRAGKKTLFALPNLCKKVLPSVEAVRGWTPHFVGAESVYFIGRGVDYAAALEGSLKLKEISYIPSEGYPAGELKHGTLALVRENTPVVAIVTQRRLVEKTMNAVNEVYSRGAKVFLITCFPEICGRKEVFSSVLIPKCREAFSPVLSVVPLQALSYYTALARGNDPDKPRNLAKSVTVE